MTYFSSSQVAQVLEVSAADLGRMITIFGLNTEQGFDIASILELAKLTRRVSVDIAAGELLELAAQFHEDMEVAVQQEIDHYYKENLVA